MKYRSLPGNSNLCPCVQCHLVPFWEIIEKDEVLTLEEKGTSLIGNKTKRILEMTPRQGELEVRRLKVSKLRIKKQIKE